MAPKPINVIIRAKDEASEQIKKITDSIKGALVSLGVAAAAVAIGEFVKSSIESFGRLQDSMALVSQALTDIGADAKALAPQVNKLAETLALRTGFKGQEILDAYAVLVRRTGDAQVAQDNLIRVLDVAAAKHIQVADAALLVANALDGLKKAQRQVNDTQGAADAQGKTLLGTLGRISEAYEQLKEKVGDTITSSEGFRDVTDKIIKLLTATSDWINDHADEVHRFMDVFAGEILSIKANVDLLIGTIPGLTQFMSVLGWVAEKSSKGALLIFASSAYNQQMQVSQLLEEKGNQMMKDAKTNEQVLGAVATLIKAKQIREDAEKAYGDVVDGLEGRATSSELKGKSDKIGDAVSQAATIADAGAEADAEGQKKREAAAKLALLEAQKKLQLGLDLDKAQQAILATIQKQNDAEVTLGAHNSEQLKQFKDRLTLAEQEKRIVEDETTSLAKEIADGKMGEVARKAAITKLTTLVGRSQALLDEVKRLEAIINASKTPKTHDGSESDSSNAGVNAANAGNSGGGLAMAGSTARAQADTVVATHAAQQQGLLKKTTEAVNKYGQAWTAAFQAMGAGAGVYKEIEKAALSTAAGIAAQAAQMEIALGTAALAKAFGGHPTAWLEAGKHFAAAALFEVVAGAAGAGAGGGGGGGGGASGQATQTTNMGASAISNGTIIIKGDSYLDMNNPAIRDALANALANVKDKNTISLIFQP